MQRFIQPDPGSGPERRETYRQARRRLIAEGATGPWIDPAAEAAKAADYIASADARPSLQEVCRARGKDVGSIVDDVVAAREYAVLQGMTADDVRPPVIPNRLI